MSLYLATHRVTVLTGATVDEYGDPVDGTTVVATDVPMSIVESTRRTMDYAFGTPRTVRITVGRAPYGTPVGQGDRVADTLSPAVWLVDGVTQQTSPVLTPDLVLDLRRVNG